MKKASRQSADELRPEYDFASMSDGVRGKDVRRLKAGSTVVLDPEVAAAFATSAAVNKALRAVLKARAVAQQRGSVRRRTALASGDRIEPASVEPLRSLRGFVRGIDTKVC